MPRRAAGARRRRRGGFPRTSRAAPGLLSGARVYLSGPMDFVASRAVEKRSGWRNRVSEFLRRLGVTVFDPWFKPEVRGLHEYGREDEATTKERERWTFRPGPVGARARAACAGKFWSSMHIDLRMVDTSDFVIAYCPTNIYSVGTPHEIIACREQRKPVLFVSPPVEFPALDELAGHLEARNDRRGRRLLDQLVAQVPIKANPEGVPSLWYMILVGGERFFDGFGFDRYRDAFPHWQDSPLDAVERRRPPVRPLLPYLERVSRELPKRYDRGARRYVPDEDWLLWDLSRSDGVGRQIRRLRRAVPR
jgi:hypothetical protein